jgi:hypothetical protein
MGPKRGSREVETERLISQRLGTKICLKFCFNHWINLLFFNFNANSMVETRLGTNFDPKPLRN